MSREILEEIINDFSPEKFDTLISTHLQITPLRKL